MPTEAPPAVFRTTLAAPDTVLRTALSAPVTRSSALSSVLPNSLRGIAFGIGTATGSLALRQMLAGVSSGAGLAIGAITLRQTIAGTATGTGTATGAVIDATAPPEIAGTATGIGTATGAITLRQVIGGAAAGAGTATGGITLRQTAAGTSSGVGTATGAITLRQTVTGATAGAGTASGAIVLRQVIAGAASGTGTAAGAVTLRQTVAGAATGTGTATGAVEIPASWSPADLFASSESGDYFDPSDLSRMWQDTAKTTAVTSDGDPVRVIVGQLGAVELVAPSDAARPVYKTSGGLHWLDFDGTNDVMSAASDFFWSAGQCSVFLGGRLVVGPDKYFVSGGNSGGTAQVMGYIRDGEPNALLGQYLRGNGAGEFLINNGTLTALDSTDRAFSFRDTGSAAYAGVNTSSQGPMSYVGGRQAVTLTNFSAGAIVRSSTGFYATMRMYGMIARGKDTSGTDYDEAMAWAATQAGVTL